MSDKWSGVGYFTVIKISIFKIVKPYQNNINANHIFIEMLIDFLSLENHPTKILASIESILYQYIM